MHDHATLFPQDLQNFACCPSGEPQWGQIRGGGVSFTMIALLQISQMPPFIGAPQRGQSGRISSFVPQEPQNFTPGFTCFPQAGQIFSPVPDFGTGSAFSICTGIGETVSFTTSSILDDIAVSIFWRAASALLATMSSPIAVSRPAMSSGSSPMTTLHSAGGETTKFATCCTFPTADSTDCTPDSTWEIVSFAFSTVLVIFFRGSSLVFSENGCPHEPQNFVVDDRLAPQAGQNCLDEDMVSLPWDIVARIYLVYFLC